MRPIYSDKTLVALVRVPHSAVMAVLIYILFAVTVVLYFLYWLSRRKFNYWEEQNVPYLEPETVFGNYRDFIFMRKTMGHVVQDICKKFPNKPYIGAFYGTEPTLIVQDPDVLKLVLTKDFYYFSGREVSKYTPREVFTRGLFFMYGDQWRVMRQNFTPMFSSAKMKNMFHLIKTCAHVLEDLLDKEAKETSVEARSLMARFTMDCIGSCAFGIDTNVMTGDVETNIFRQMGDLVFEHTNKRGLAIVGRTIWPAIFYGIGMKAFSTELEKFFHNLLTGVFKARDYKPSSRNDLVDLVLGFRKQQYITGDSIMNAKVPEEKIVRIKVDDKMMVAQCLTFFAAGFETSSTTLSFTLFELAKNKEAQQKAIKEVDEYLLKHENKLDYDCTKELAYLTACVDEALRLYPVVSVLTREVVEDYVLPCGGVLKPGVRVHIPVYSLHRDPLYFPDPEMYKPERFLPENQHTIKPYTYMPFGEGPRICIGLRFARMQMMAGLITLLKSYSVELAPGTKPTVTYEPRAITTQPREGIRLTLVARASKERRVFVR